MRVHVVCTGLSPILMNPVTEELLDQLRGRTPKPKVLDKSVEDEAGEKLYRDADGNVGIPALNLYSCLIEAGRRVGTGRGRTNISTATSTLLPSFLSIEELFLPFLADNPEWVVDKRRGRNPNGGEAVCLIRPRFDHWQFAFTLDITDGEVDLDRIRLLVNIAGSSVGLCDFRPAKKGPFGRFAVTAWEILEHEETAVVSQNGRADHKPVLA